jgi:hypothetical protein
VWGRGWEPEAIADEPLFFLLRKQCVWRSEGGYSERSGKPLLRSLSIKALLSSIKLP